MTPYDIRAKIVQAGTSQTAIAKFLNVRPASVGRVISGSMRSARIEAELSKIVGETINSCQPKKSGRPMTVYNGQIEPSFAHPDRRVDNRRDPKTVSSNPTH